MPQTQHTDQQHREILRNLAHRAMVERGFEGLDVGDRIHVQLLSVDVERGYIDFGKGG